VNALSRGAAGVGMGGAGLCHVEREGLRFLVPVGHERELFGTGLMDRKLIISESSLRLCVSRLIS
jgi:hypothetical protein